MKSQTLLCFAHKTRKCMSAMRSVYYIEELERENKIQLKIDGERDTKKPKQTGKNSNI